MLFRLLLKLAPSNIPEVTVIPLPLSLSLSLSPARALARSRSLSTSMTRRSRILGDVNSSTKASDQSRAANNVDSDFVVILAALLCALICVLGLVAVARCAWIRRISFRASNRPAPSPLANQGLKKKVLNSLPKLTYAVENAAQFSDCAICLAEFVVGDEVRVLPQCGHGFHVGCIDTWLGSHSSCPSCRRLLMAVRCRKCGGLPPWNSAEVAEAETRLEQQRQNDVNSFLP